MYQQMEISMEKKNVIRCHYLNGGNKSLWESARNRGF